MVLLQPEGPKVPQRRPSQPHRRLGVLEGDGHRQADHSEQRERQHWGQEGSGVLQGKTAQGGED